MNRLRPKLNSRKGGPLRQICALVAFAFVVCPAQGYAENASNTAYPSLTISNGELNLTIYLPDVKKGYYRGTRFDWSGQIARADFKNHQFFGEWQSPHDPLAHDHAIGPAEEFSMENPPGFTEAKIGEGFLKIGVGILKKGVESKYSFHTPQTVLHYSNWSIDHGNSWVEFKQELKCEAYACVYIKRITINADEPAFEISHILKNTGEVKIETTHYCHNFVTIDKEPIGPSYRLSLPFNCKFSERSGKTQFSTEGRTFWFTEPVLEGNSFWGMLSDSAAAQSDFKIDNLKTNAGVKITTSDAAFKFVIYAQKLALCAEPFVLINVKAGAEAIWSSRYKFYLGKLEK